MELQDRQDLREISGKVSHLEAQVESLKTTAAGLKEGIDKLVSKAEFAPVKLIVYGLCASVLTGVIGALLSRVLIK